ncbi:hypothetical protein AB0J86_37260 [Micromonospora sp. NPDC049559]|uniref:hypothetical protein n=1 Tax=Micromonospora sp. NPDC049559 TaxID=3155923 RepID=UPI00343080C9
MIESTGRRWLTRLAGTVAAAVLLGAVPAGFAAPSMGVLPTGPGGAGDPLGRAPRPDARSPRPGDPAGVTAAWLGQRIAEQLDRQAEALLHADEPGFVALADPGAPVAAELSRQFRSLRALRVTVWEPEVRDQPVEVNGRPGEWWLPVTYRYCFVAAVCSPEPLTAGTRWSDAGGRPRLVALVPSTGDEKQQGPRPWEVSDLHVLVGRRTVVATTGAYRDRLGTLLTEAERAASVADRYAVPGPPERYRIFYAGPDEWRRWYGGGRAGWTAGYAVATGGGYDVVLNAGVLAGMDVEDLLRHEMTHAASLPARGYPRTGIWWLVEGIAELAASGAGPVAEYEGLAAVRRLLDEGWNGRLDGVEVAPDAADWQVSGSYGIGYLSVRHLVDRFGEQRVLAFFRTVVHERRPIADASRLILGQEWSVLHDECVSYLRAVARRPG